MNLPETLAALYQHLQDIFKAAGLESPDLEARLILKERMAVDWAAMIAGDQRPVSHEILSRIEEDITRRLAGEPLSRIYGRRGFWDMDLELSADTLDPRPDTEILVEAALKACQPQPQRILDLGTGTGCIVLALLKEWPETEAVAVDISEGALRTAKRNAQDLGFMNRMSFICGSWAESVNSRFDLVVSNPPYIRSDDIANLTKEVRNHDPILALDGGKDGLEAYKKIFSDLLRLLNPDGKAFFEIGFDQGDDTMRLVENAGLKVLNLHRDYAGQPRVLEISRGDK